MGKVKWGGAELAEEIDNAPESEFNEYDGPKPPRGVYRFRITKMMFGKSTNDFNQVVNFLEMDDARPSKAQYRGFFMMDWVIVKDDGSTGFRVKPFLAALGVTPKQFVTMTVIDEEDDGQIGPGFTEGYPITKIGPKKVPGNLVWGSIRPSKRDPEYFDIRYLESGPDGDEPAESDAGTGDDGEPPF